MRLRTFFGLYMEFALVSTICFSLQPSEILGTIYIFYDQSNSVTLVILILTLSFSHTVATISSSIIDLLLCTIVACADFLHIVDLSASNIVLNELMNTFIKCIMDTYQNICLHFWWECS